MNQAEHPIVESEETLRKKVKKYDKYKREAERKDSPKLRELLSKGHSPRDIKSSFIKITLNALAIIARSMRVVLSLPKNGKWAYIPGSNNHYCISIRGEVLSCRKFPMWKKVVVFDDRGYPGFSFVRFSEDGSSKNVHIRLHQALLTCFGPPRPTVRHIACHSNDNREDFRLRNLYWGTQRDNALDRSKNQRVSSYTKMDLVKKIYQANGSHIDVSERFGVQHTTVRGIRCEKNFSDFTKNLKKGVFNKYRQNQRLKRRKYLMTDAQVKHFRIHAKKGQSILSMSKAANLKHCAVYAAVCGKTYTWVKEPPIESVAFYKKIKNLPRPLTLNPVEHGKPYDKNHMDPAVRKRA